MKHGRGFYTVDRIWIIDFAEKLSKVEGRFELNASIFLKYENQFVLGLRDSKDWLYENGKRRASLATFNGKLEEAVDAPVFLKNHCFQELGVSVQIEDSPHTYMDYHHRLKRLPAHTVKGEIRPHMISIIQKPRYSASPNTLIFSYLGNTKNKPHAIKYSSLIFIKERILVQMFKKEKTVQELKEAGAIFEERIKIPDHLYLYPTGSLNSLLRFLSYEVF